jgi:uncharacterized protein YbaR (Trm112 family)
MLLRLLDYICDPIDKSDLTLENAKRDDAGNIVEGTLRSESGRVFPIVNGVPRFVQTESNERK